MVILRVHAKKGFLAFVSLIPLFHEVLGFEPLIFALLMRMANRQGLRKKIQVGHALVA
jgi:hypothetical protein